MDTPDGHGIVIEDNPKKDRISISCECGCSWTVSRKEFEAGTDHIADHFAYAKRPLLKPD